jgi:hypothetical protein
MSISSFTGTLVFETVREATRAISTAVVDVDERFGDRITPRDLRQWLAGLRMLENVPFAYLVADSLQLPPESIRFFYVDRAWTDALVQGALSVGTVNSADRAQLEALHRQLRDEIDEEERLVRAPGGEQVQQGPAGTITGFLLRSRAVSGWPAMHVRAYRREVGKDNEIIPESHPDRIKLLRLERLAPAVLFALFDGVPQLVHLEEPRQGLQFGVRLQQAGGPNSFSAHVFARDAATSNDIEPFNKMKVAFRPGSPGVLNLRNTAQTFLGTAGTNMGPDLDGAELALQMLRFPYRQVFGDTSVGGAPAIVDVFKPTIALSRLKATFQERLP